MSKYIFTKKESAQINKHGIDLTIYEGKSETASVVRISCKKGHFEEFYNKISTFIYYIISGEITFFLNGEPHKAEQDDLVVIPPNTKIYYKGQAEMLLTVSPSWKEENEVHVRDIGEKI